VAQRQLKPTTVDFETFGIEGRPDYPPAPVGVSIKKWGKAPRYYAWGHPTENNCTQAQAVKALQEAYACPDGVLFHNGRFDTDVAEVHLGLPVPSWERYHDTLFLLFLDNPHSFNLGLKPNAKSYLGMEPEERDAVVDWLLEHQPLKAQGVRITKSKDRKSKHPAGKYIALAPGKLVGDYANGDVIRTEGLFAHLWKKTVIDRQMGAAYDRERKLMPIFLDMERRGLRVDLARLEHDVALYTGWQRRLDAWLLKRLACDPNTNLDSDDQLYAILMELDLLDLGKMGRTKTGKVSLNGISLAAGLKDPLLASVLRYRTQLGTCMGTFMRPWLEVARRSGGLIFTQWNQVRSPDGGTRTGRLSSSGPNFQNIPKEFEKLFDGVDEKGRALPKCPWKDLPPLPLCRSYVVPYYPDHVLADRDYSQQEPRILAHFEDGELMVQYTENPWIDYHDNAKEQLERVFKRPFKRKPVKNINLGIIYGQGIASLAVKNGETFEDTQTLQRAVLNLYPGLKDLRDSMKLRARAQEPIRTWGGREYYCEPPRVIDGQLRTFDYKMVNVLIQGSAADCTKEAIIRFYAVKEPHWIVLLQVHDELLLSVPAEELVWALEVLRATMESVEFDVKILSEGSWSDRNWAALVDYDKKGKVVAPEHSLPPNQRSTSCASSSRSRRPSSSRSARAPDAPPPPRASSRRPASPSRAGAGRATRPTASARSSLPA
jgi:DNA polymerase I-like protein with 3'-5' exonuclease and polymerase domains